MATLGLLRCTQASQCSGFSCRGPRALSVRASVVVAQTQLLQACGIFPNQGSNLCPPTGQSILNHWTTRKSLEFNFQDTSQGYLLEIRVLRFSEGCFHFEKNFQIPVLLCWVQRLATL